MTKEITFYFDFASPNAYLAYQAMPGILARTGASLRIAPALLGGIFKATGNVAPFVAFGGVKGKLDYEMLELRRFVARHQLDKFRMNPHFPVNTLQMMRGLVACGCDRTYLEAVLRGLWEDGLNMADSAVLQEVLAQAGLDGAGILEKAAGAEAKALLAADTEAAVARGVFGLPTFFVGDEMFFGKDRLEAVERYVVTGVA